VPLQQSGVYMYDIHPELGLGNCPFRSGKGAGPSLEGVPREQNCFRRSTKGAGGSSKGAGAATAEHRGSKWTK